MKINIENVRDLHNCLLHKMLITLFINPNQQQYNNISDVVIILFYTNILYKGISTGYT